MHLPFAIFLSVFVASTTACAGELCVASNREDKRIAAALKQDLKRRYQASLQLADLGRVPAPLHVNARPGCRGNATLDVYGVTTAEEFKRIEVLARQSQSSVTPLGSLTLRFFEQEVWVHVQGGGGYRGKENLLQTVLVQPAKAQVGAPR